MPRTSQVLILLGFILILLTYIRGMYLIDSLFWSLEYDAIQEELGDVKRSNLLLKERLLSISSLQYLEPEARKRGFVQATYYYP